MSDEFKPCPFCGSKKIEIDTTSETPFFWTRCINCGAEGPVDLGKSGAIERWNDRTGQRTILNQDELAELEQRLYEAQMLEGSEMEY